MSNLTTLQQDYVPAPERDRGNHIPSIGDVYMHKNKWGGCFRIIGFHKHNENTLYDIERYDFLAGEWIKDEDPILEDNLKEYYILLLCPFDEILAAAKASLDGDKSQVETIMSQAENSQESLDLIVSRPAEQVFALAEANERIQDKLKSVSRVMNFIVESKKAQMEAQVRALDEKLDVIRDVVKNIQRVITVMNLYTGNSVDVKVISDGEAIRPSPSARGSSLWMKNFLRMLKTGVSITVRCSVSTTGLRNQKPAISSVLNPSVLWR